MPDSRPIGVFDSGLGGLTVCRAIREELPAENLIYFGDTARFPYGPKSQKTICRYATEITDYLISRDVKAIVVACNTASIHALSTLQANYDIPILGVITPGVESALANGSKQIGIIGTKGTISSQEYQKQLLAKDPDLRIFSRPTSMLVSLVEEGWHDDSIADAILEKYLADMVPNIQSLILGCTHFPLLKPVIQTKYPKLELIDSSLAMAQSLASRISDPDLRNDLNENGSFSFVVSDISQVFINQVEKFFGQAISPVELAVLEN